MTPIYGTKSSDRWNSQPAKMDTLNMRIRFDSTNEWGIPDLDVCTFEPAMLAAWHSPKQRTTAAMKGGALHFFLDDYRFERVWTSPEQTYERVAEVGAALSPDFSMWRDMPRAAQLWQTFRSRWMAAFWQHLSVDVVPSLTWGRDDTYDFAFAGIPKHSHVAITPLSVRKEGRQLFVDGLQAMIEMCEPSKILCYGKLPVDVDVPVREYPTFWDTRRPS